MPHTAARDERHAGDSIAGTEVATAFDHVAGEVGAEDVREREPREGVASGSGADVEQASDADGANAHEHLAGRRLGSRRVLDLQHVGRAELVDDCRFQLAPPTRVGEPAEVADLHLHEVAGPQELAAREADAVGRAGGDDVAGLEREDPASSGDQRRHAIDHVRGVGLLLEVSVDPEPKVEPLRIMT